MAISRRADSLDLGVPLDREGAHRSLGGHLRRWLPIGIGILMAVAMIVLAAAAPLIAPLSPSAQYSDAVLKGPGAVERHLLGTDEFGRDILSRIMYGARIALFVGFAAQRRNLDDTATTAEFSANSFGTILSSVSAEV